VSREHHKSEPAPAEEEWFDRGDDELLPEGDEPHIVSPPPILTRATGRPRADLRGPWKVLVVDDDKSVRTVSELALKGLSIDGRPIVIILASTAAEAREVLRAHDDVAVALIDVIMESTQAGLELVEWIRATLGNWSMRLVIRTGEPGNAPESKVMADYELHDYLSKSETTARRLISCVMGAIRAWRDQHTIRQQRTGLRHVLSAVDELLDAKDRAQLLKSVVTQACGLLEPHAALGWCLEYEGDQPGRVIASRPSGFSPDADLLVRLRDDLSPGRVTCHDGLVLYRFDSEPGRDLVLGLVHPATTPWEGQLLELYCHAVALSLRHRHLWETSLRDMQRALEEREVMLREIHHRVKNNLQITASLLALQADASDSDAARVALEDSCARVRSMALVHHQLYAGHDLARVEFDEFIRALAPPLRTSLDPHAEIDLALDRVTLAIDKAIPSGLILNELLTNALKHGRGEDGRSHIRVSLSRVDDEALLVVEDSGRGLSGPYKQISRQSLGLQMVSSLTYQMKARITATNNPGARFEIAIPLEAGLDG
jgi:two-component sensor histidine kinase